MREWQPPEREISGEPAPPAGSTATLDGRLRLLDLFSGIGGFSLGLERSGAFRTVAFCEIEEFPRRVLAKHWPEVPCYHDIRELTAERLAADGIAVDAICGGFPCQDVSVAGRRAGLDGERSGLWSEYRRLIGKLRPGVIIVENTPGLLSLGMGTVLGDLAAIGYDAEWECIPANRVGAPHERDRVWIIAYPYKDGLQEREHVAGTCGEASGRQQAGCSPDGMDSPAEPADTEPWQFTLGRTAGRVGRFIQSVPRKRAWPITSQPVLDRGADGVSHRLDRLRCLGNAVVPQIPEMIGRAIARALHQETLHDQRSVEPEIHSGR